MKYLIILCLFVPAISMATDIYVCEDEISINNSGLSDLTNYKTIFSKTNVYKKKQKFTILEDGTASKTESLVDSQGIVRTAAQFLASDSDDSTSGALSIRNNNGMTVGLTDNHVVKVTNLGVVAENNVSGEDYILRMTTSLGKRDAITIKSADNRVGIYNDSPAETLDVGGNVKISGNLRGLAEGSWVGKGFPGSGGRNRGEME